MSLRIVDTLTDEQAKEIGTMLTVTSISPMYNYTFEKIDIIMILRMDVTLKKKMKV